MTDRRGCRPCLGRGARVCRGAADLACVGRPGGLDATGQERKVNATATVGDVTVAVGDFTKVREHGAMACTSRKDLFAFDSTGRISRTFRPKVNGSEVFDVVLAGDGQTVYIGGLFHHRQRRQPQPGRPHRRQHRPAGLVVPGPHLQPEGHQPSSRQRQAVRRLPGSEGSGQKHTTLASLNPATGARTNHLDLTFTKVWSHRRDRRTGEIIRSLVGVEGFAITPDGSRLVAIGSFLEVEGRPRAQIVMVNTSGRKANLHSWSTNRFHFKGSPSCDTHMWGVDFAP